MLNKMRTFKSYQLNLMTHFMISVAQCITDHSDTDISIVSDIQHRSHCALWIGYSVLSGMVFIVDKRWNNTYSHNDNGLKTSRNVFNYKK